MQKSAGGLKTTMATMKSQKGATMIEVLVTILVLSVGLLGLSATQVMSLKNANNSHHRYMAVLAAQEMAERLRGNFLGVQDGLYDDKKVDGSETKATCRSMCGPQQLARADLYDWGQLIKQNLPAGEGAISRDEGTFTLTMTWSEQHTGEKRGSAAGGTEESQFVMVVEL
ncbi:hypothetical protein Maes01_01623 [Microbulbifer aestuariivivens]|uniref:Type IV pilus modification protein PilV n=2 Tax=Microbulbifer aestuariivivens TaxID=1908308 RepID=A0ABP9WPD8_9GAMM